MRTRSSRCEAVSTRWFALVRAHAYPRRERGFISVEYMMAVAFTLLFLVMMTNLVVVQYGRGVVRAAVDEGARAGALVDNSLDRCNERATSMLDNISGIGKANDVRCIIEGDQVEARASVQFAAWLPGIPTMTENATAVSRKERAPA